MQYFRCNVAIIEERRSAFPQPMTHHQLQESYAAAPSPASNVKLLHPTMGDSSASMQLILEQKLTDFVLSEIVNRFLAKRLDFGVEDPAKLMELTQRVVREINSQVPRADPVKDVCELYSLVDVVADRLAATYAVQSSSGKAPVQGESVQMQTYPQMWKEFSWKVIGQQLLEKAEEGNGNASRFAQALMQEKTEPSWIEGQDSSES